MPTILQTDPKPILDALATLQTKVEQLAEDLRLCGGGAPIYLKLAPLAKLLGMDRSTLRPLLVQGVMQGKIRRISAGSVPEYCVADTISFLQI